MNLSRIRKGHRRHGAFTLIELVISAALMAMILGSAFLCLHAAVTSQKLIEAREEIFQNARVAMALITADLRSACPISKEFDFVGMQRTLNEVRADNLDFATHNYSPGRAAEGDWCEVSYFVERDPKTRTLKLWRRRDATPDEDPFSGGTREEIAEGLAGLKFEYYDGLDWFDEWGDPQGRGKAQNSFKARTNLSGLPEAVRITMWFGASSETKNETPDEPKPAREAPLVFQTVARLNLAAAALRATSSSSSPPSQSAGQPVTSPGGAR